MPLLACWACCSLMGTIEKKYENIGLRQKLKTFKKTVASKIGPIVMRLGHYIHTLVMTHHITPLPTLLSFFKNIFYVIKLKSPFFTIQPTQILLDYHYFSFYQLKLAMYLIVLLVVPMMINYHPQQHFFPPSSL